MSIRSLTQASILATSILGAAAATAVPVTFDFSNGASASNASFLTTLEMSSGGVDLDVTAYKNTLLGWKSVLLSQWDSGLGVNGGASSTQVDGAYRDEALVFDFSQDVALKSISFMLFDGNDQAVVMDYDADFFWDTYVADISKGETSTSGGISSFTFSENFFSSLLGVLAIDHNDNFTVLSMTVDTARASVPEPSTVALLGIGLIGLGLCRRRSASVAA